MIGLALVFSFLFFSPSAQAESLAALTSRADWNCVAFQPTGQVCRRATPPYVGVQMRYWQPALLLETVKRPGDTAINEFRPLVGEPLKRAVSAAMGVPADTADSGSTGSFDTTSVQMNDAHVFGFPFSNMFSGMIEPACEGPADFSGTVSYLSEMDALEWRTLRTESNHPLSVLTARSGVACDRTVTVSPGMCMGVWGPLYPRGGFVAGASQAVGSAAAAYRAVDIASLNILTPHQREMPLLFLPDMFWDRMQMVYPKATKCLRIGADPRYWENNRVSYDGKYVWIYWRKKECCLF